MMKCLIRFIKLNEVEYEELAEYYMEFNQNN
jgi:hypothetical protein